MKWGEVIITVRHPLHQKWWSEARTASIAVHHRRHSVSSTIASHPCSDPLVVTWEEDSIYIYTVRCGGGRGGDEEAMQL